MGPDREGLRIREGKFVVLKDEDFKRVDIEATQTVDIIGFRGTRRGESRCFSTSPITWSRRRAATRPMCCCAMRCKETGKIGIAKVVIKTRQHLAAVKPQEEGLMLELMHFAIGAEGCG